MSDQPVKRYALCYRCGVTDYKRRSDCNHPGSSQPMVLEADFSRTDAELRKERSARVEAEAKLDPLLDALASQQKELERIASLESDLSAVTASSVEHAKTIDGLRADLARARELAVRLLIVHEDRDEQTAKAIFDSARSATHNADTGGKG